MEEKTLEELKQQVKEQRLFGEELDRRIGELEVPEELPIKKPEPFIDIPFNPRRKIDKLTLGNIEGITKISVYTSSDQTISDNSETQVQFDTELYDALNEFDTSTYKFTAKRDGEYLITAQGRWKAAAGGDQTRHYIEIDKNNGTAVALDEGQSSGTGAFSQGCSKILQLVAGDTIEVNVYQNSGGNRDLEASHFITYLTIQQLS